MNKKKKDTVKDVSVEATVKNHDVTDDDIKNVVIGVNKYNFRDVVIGKKFGDEIKYCALIEYKEIKVPKTDKEGKQLFDTTGQPLEDVQARVFFLPFGFPISYECNTAIHKDDFIPIQYSGNNNTPDFHRGIEDIKKRYIHSLKIS